MRAVARRRLAKGSFVMTANLSKEDVERLIKEPSATVRAEVAGKLALDVESPSLTESEMTLAQEVVRLMARDVEASVRKALAYNLRRAARLPHDIAVQLASDIDQVALPILQESSVLTDQDLVSIIANGSATKHEAIAGRDIVSSVVSDALISTAGEKAVATLMNNVGAQISEQGYGKALSRFEQSDVVKESVCKRKVLPPAVAERLAFMVSERLQEYLVSHHDLSPAVAADLVLQSRERTIVEMASGSSEEEMERLVGQMHANGRLTPSIVLRALCMGDILFFESALAVRAGIPVLNARILIHDGGQLGLKTLCDRADMPAGMQAVIRVALDVVHETELGADPQDLIRYRARVIERILTRFEEGGSDDFDYLLAKLGDILTLEKSA